MEKLKNRIELIDMFNRRGFKTGAEIGVWKGEYSKKILERTKAVLFCVDPWDGTGMSVNFDGDEICAKTTEDLSRFDGRARIIRSTSENAAELFSDEYFDFIYIDAKHDYDSVKQDVGLWLPKVRKSGGILSGHDYNNRGKKGVKRAILEMFDEKIVNYTGEKCCSWWIEL